ncbi:hypothetical protein ACFL27_10725 [candidate division CSSED10-310 bacterium]|uniref:HEAT repeat domain-containing protein n=1 Tax=candidate division CSSED10-310 bacterium TaxID=2855610 RepID=A0ABV6YWR8_UNCC1
MNEKQYQKYVQLMKLPFEERKRLASTATGESQLLLSYDPHMEVTESLLDNPYITSQSILNLVKRRNTPLKLLEKIAENKTWLAEYDLKFELIKNPRTPSYISLKLLRYLFRKELQSLARDVSVSNIIRQATISILEAKLSELLPGEKMALAKEAVGPLLTMLLNDPDDRVVRVALQNTRLRENDVVIMANRRDISSKIIAEISKSRWLNRYPIKVAIAHNRQTPIPLAIKIIGELFQQDLQEIMKNPTLPTSTRMNARVILKKRIFCLPPQQLHRLAKTGRRELVNILIEKEDLNIIKLLEENPNVAEGQFVSLAVKTCSEEILEYLVCKSHWRNNPKLIQALYHNEATPSELRASLLERMEV